MEEEKNNSSSAEEKTRSEEGVQSPERGPDFQADCDKVRFFYISISESDKKVVYNESL